MKKSDRLLLLDVFRGITVAGMILFNNSRSWGTIYPPVKHAEWNDCISTDLIFHFDWVWFVAASGRHKIKAIAFDNKGEKKMSEPIDLFVIDNN